MAVRVGRLWVVFVVTLATTARAVAEAASACPRGLSDLLDSPACGTHRRHMATTAHTTLDGATVVRDVCVDSLRQLLAMAPSMPCTTRVAPSSHPKDPFHTRQLTSGDSARPFKGQLNCTFATVAPLNVSDLRQHFVVDCEEIKAPEDLRPLWIVLGCVGGVFALVCLGACCWEEMIDPCLEKHYAHRREQAIVASAVRAGGYSYALA